ncbi:tol-pal system protein YbgF [Halomonas garicola]|uniref:tol-pal system protein YbgF n=1 Tax=Halomonas garicola TaxID=1690008 RepID=UPI0028A0D5EA|nr:tol-pal system protein YbgF [Halomonas garicola]
MTSSWVTAEPAIARWRGAALKSLCYLALAGALGPGQALAQGPSVDDLSGSPDGFYDQTETRSSGSLVLFNQVQEHQRELKELRGDVEELRHELKQLRRQSQKRYLDLDERLANAASASTAAPASGEDEAADADDEPTASDRAKAESNAEALSDSAGAESAGAEQAAGQADNKEAQKAYQQAFAHVQAREFDEATAAFKQFVSDYPDTRLTPNGYYWLGELYAAGDNLDAADQAFTRVIEEHADSSKVPDAMYKLGLMKARQGDSERSRELLEKLRDDYPQSSAAGLAGDFLRQSQ